VFVLITCEDPRPNVWSMCAACFCPCISLSRATPPGRSRYQTSEFPATSEFPTELPTHRYPCSLCASLFMLVSIKVMLLHAVSCVRSSLEARYSAYRATSIIRNSLPLGPYMYGRPMPRALWWS